MNAKKILSLTVVTFSAVTVIVACGPKDRSHVDVTKGNVTGNTTPGAEDRTALAPEKITAVPKNEAAKLELSKMKADKARFEISKKILLSVQDVTLIQIQDKVRVRVVRNKNLKNDLLADKQVLVVEVPATSTGNKLEQVAPQTSDLGEIKVYYDPTTKAVDTIKITDTSDTTANYFVMFKVGTSGAVVTPKISGDKKAVTVAQNATQPTAVLNLKKVFKSLQEAQINAAQPYMTEMRAYLDKDNQSLFETLIIPAMVQPADNLMAPAVDASQSLFALSLKLSKADKSVTVANLLVVGQGGDALSLPNTLGIPMDFIAVGSEASSNELDLSLRIHGTGIEVVPWTLHVSRVAAGTGKLLKFTDNDEDAAPPATVVVNSDGSGTATTAVLVPDTTTPASSATVTSPASGATVSSPASGVTASSPASGVTASSGSSGALTSTTTSTSTTSSSTTTLPLAPVLID